MHTLLFCPKTRSWETDTMRTILHTNDTVRLTGYPQLWRAVNTINGNKADIQRMNDYNPHIVTVALDQIHIVRRFGSPNSSF